MPKSVSICVESLWIAFFIPEIEFQISKFFDFRSQKFLYRKFSDYHWFWSFVITCSKRSTCRKEELRHQKNIFLRKNIFRKNIEKTSFLRKITHRLQKLSPWRPNACANDFRHSQQDFKDFESGWQLSPGSVPSTSRPTVVKSGNYRLRNYVLRRW